MAKQKIKYRIRKGGSNGGESRKLTAVQKGKYLLIVALLIAGGFGLYQYFSPDKYEYWNQLIAKDPKPQGVSEAEYREKLRAGYCWRDRKFYKPEELQQKAMVGFVGRLLGEAKAYRTDSTILQGRTNYTGADCKRHKTACSVWFSTQGYTNAQWDKLFLAEKNPADIKFLAQYMSQEIKQPDYLNGYFAGNSNKGFSLISRSYGKESATIYGSDCCRVLDKKAAEPMIGENEWIAYFEMDSIFPENDVPKDIEITDYGVGNFYFEFREVVPIPNKWGADESKNNQSNEKRTYQLRYPTILMMNNCGDILWQPYTLNLTKAI